MKLFRYDKPIYEKIVEGTLIQVVDRGDRRELCFGNHIVQSARSLTADDVLLLDYTRAMMAGFLFVPQATRILHFGLGGGSLPDFIHRHQPQAQQRVVELNLGVVDVAYRYFALPVSPRLEVVNQEGAEFLQRHEEHYDLIFLDAFHAEGAAPHLNTLTFFRLLRAHLSPGGWLVSNCWGSDSENLRRVRGNLGALFSQLVSLSVRADSNVIFIASPEPEAPSPAMLKRRAQELKGRFPLDFEGLLYRLRPTFAPMPAPPLASRAGP